MAQAQRRWGEGAAARRPDRTPAELEEEVELLREENRRLRQYLNDPDWLCQRAVKLLAGMGTPVLTTTAAAAATMVLALLIAHPVT